MSKINKSNEGKEKNLDMEEKDYTPEADSFEEPNMEEIDDIDWEVFREDLKELYNSK
ncbi:MAG: hypothetical protein HC913_05260 [Microscillaceae bacterium]|nr:hypothetical protein [Microscillaceae bacterium]